MELTNKNIILIAIAVIFAMAVLTGIIIKNSMDSDQYKQLNSSGNVIANNTKTQNIIVTANPTGYTTATPTITTPAVNADQGPMNNSSTTVNITPTVTVSVTPSNNPETSGNSTTSFGPPPGFNNNNVPLNENNRVTVLSFFSDNLNENDTTPFWNSVANLNSVSDAKATLIKTGYDPNTKVAIYDLVNIPNNPLMASNCIVHGKPAYTFTNVPKLTGETNFYIVLMVEKDGRAWTLNGGDGGPGVRGLIQGNESVDIIPGDVTRGTIYGYIREFDKARVNTHLASGANVTLYYYPHDKGMVNVSNNPQVSFNGPEAGFFRFDGLEPGLYDVVAEKDGLTGHYIVNLTGTESILDVNPVNGLAVDIDL